MNEVADPSDHPSGQPSLLFLLQHLQSCFIPVWTLGPVYKFWCTERIFGYLFYIPQKLLLDPWDYMDDSLKVMDITYLFTEISKTIAAVKKFHGTWWKKANLYQPKLFSKVFSVCRYLSVSIIFPYHRSPPGESSSMWGRRNLFGSTKFTDKFT